MTLLEELVERYPNADWDWNQLSLNPSISFKFIINHRTMHWNANNVSRNISITEDDILQGNYPWNYSGIFANPNLNYKFFEEKIINCKHVLHIDWALLSANPSIETLDIINHPYHPWNDKFLSANPNITSSFILNEGSKRFWYAPSVSANPGITKRDIVKSTLKQLFDWDYINLSINPNLPLAYVNDNIDKQWNWFEISKVASMTDIERFYNFKWNDIGLSMNKNISMQFILNHPHIDWDKQYLLTNSAISLNDIYENLDWFAMHINDIKKYVCSNQNISFEWVSDNINYIDWKRLSNNILL